MQPDALPGEYRYRLLLVQSGQRVKEFQGTLQFVVNLEQSDRKFVLTLPPEDAEERARSTRSTSSSSSAWKARSRWRPERS